MKAGAETSYGRVRPVEDRAASVLVADDHPPMRSLLRPLLERGGFYVCAEAGDAAAAIDLALSTEPDLCLLDIRMPGNGIAATAGISAMLPATKIVILTVSRSDSDLIRAVQAGAVGYVLKDQSLHQLARALWRVLDGEALLSGDLTARLLDEIRLGGRRKFGLGRQRDQLLTAREWQVLELLAEDRTTAEIADRLAIQEVTVRTHISSVLRKYQVESRQAALRRYRRQH
jgi:DNA-binding NarL/FixJ family response regulator